MRQWSWFLTAVMSGIVATAGMAQQVPNGPDQAPIVVEGHRDRNGEIREMVNALPPAPSNGHISRFEHSACPAMVGLSPAQRALVVQRMRTVAKAAGVPLGKPDCRPNVLVLVTSDKREFIEQLSRRFPSYMGELGDRDIARLAQSPSPTALWHLSSMVDADGRPVTVEGTTVPVLRTIRPGSRLSDSAHREFVGSVLVVDVHALLGLSTTQFADYAAMRTFTGADPARLRERGVSTILTVLDAPMGSAVPLTLTKWDLAFLESVYASDASGYAPLQRSEIKVEMDRRLEPTEAPVQHHKQGPASAP